jgi:AcrR family transcriptional regulator
VREICEAAGVTKPTLYHFYGSKEGVYRALVEGTLEQYRKGIGAIVEAEGSVPERLKEVVRRHFHYTCRQPQLVRFLLSLIHNPPGSAPATDLSRVYGDVLAHYARLIEQGIDDCSLKPGPVEVRLLVFSGAMMEPIHRFLFGGRPELTPELADTLVDTILRGWSAPSTA